MEKHVVASAELTIDAPADEVYRYLTNMYLQARFLPPPFYDFQVEEGGMGAGSVVSFKIKFAGGVQELRMKVTEPEPGRTLVQTDTGSRGLVRTFTVTPHGEQSLVNITSRFDGETGIAGIVEGLVAPRRLHRIYIEELTRLNTYAHEQRECAQ
ncbi:Polyketide cyclase / dehydrase and lipid transport [compost metagenome]